MPAYKVWFKLSGRAYGSYPDAHAILSTLYNLGVQDKNLRVSGLLPVVNERVLFPVSTSLLWRKELLKDTRSMVKAGRLFSEDPCNLGSVSAELETFIVPRNALDRITRASNLYFERGWYVVSGNSVVQDFAFIIYHPDDDAAQKISEDLKNFLHGVAFGGNKSHGAAVEPASVRVEQYSGPALSTDSGILLSLALPGDVPPKHYPVVYEKWVFWQDATTEVMMRKSFGVYGAGSYLSYGEYTSGDISVGEDARGFEAKLFARPLFLKVSCNGE